MSFNSALRSSKCSEKQCALTKTYGEWVNFTFLESCIKLLKAQQYGSITAALRNSNYKVAISCCDATFVARQIARKCCPYYLALTH